MPTHCPCCKQLNQNNKGLCPLCWGKIDFITEPSCNRCGAPLTFKMEESIVKTCRECYGYQYFFDKSVSCCVYAEGVKSLILRFKKNDEIYLKKIFSEWLFIASQSWIHNFDIMVPIPFHPIKTILRTHNQSLTIAQDFFMQLRNKVDWCGNLIPNLLQSKKILSIHHLSSYSRFQAIEGTLSFSEENLTLIKNKNILIIDDVITTGSTMSEAARVLKKNGARKVYGLTIARTLKKRH